MKTITLYQVHAAEGRPLYTRFPYRRAQRAVRLLKHFGLKGAYIAGPVRVNLIERLLSSDPKVVHGAVSTILNQRPF